MAYTLNEEIPCRTEACTSGEHRPASACNSVYDIILDAIKDVKGDVANIDALAKEQTLLNKVAELKSALSTIDFTTIEQAIKDVKAGAAKEDTLIQGVGDIIKALESMQVDVDLTPVAKETTLNSAKAEIITAIENAKPEIDTSELAKQGENPEATMSAVYEAVKSLPDLSLLYAARAEKNDDGENTYSIILPVTAKVTYDNNGVATIQL